MSIYWKRTADVYPDAGYGPNTFMAFDPQVRFPRFHMGTGDKTIGNVHLIQGGPQDGRWHWSMTVSLPGPRYGPPTNGTKPTRGAAGRRVVEVYRHHLSTRPEQYAIWSCNMVRNTKSRVGF
ncbi:hypothetical protein [Microvirga massiliensis]|uniref:hypothetical protein n=1 Tax=Microvirga massiliensis TaxID=1033741 RepID=UPI00062B94DE|nr:hypothetical protein [Microvirga massiliensis]